MPLYASEREFLARREAELLQLAARMHEAREREAGEAVELWALWRTEVPDHGGLRVRPWQQDLIFLSATRTRLGTYRSESGLMLLLDERIRAEAMALVEASGLPQPRPLVPLEDYPGYPNARIRRSSGHWHIVGIRDKFAEPDGFWMAQLTGDESVLTVAVDALVEPVLQLLARHGLLFTDLEVSDARPEYTPGHGVPWRFWSPEVEPTVPRGTPDTAAGTVAGSRLIAPAAALIPDKHRAVLEDVWRRNPWRSRPDQTRSNDFREWGAWDAAFRDRIRGRDLKALQMIELPDVAADHLRTAQRLSPLHAPMLAAALIVTADPDWFTQVGRNAKVVSAGRTVARLTSQDSKPVAGGVELMQVLGAERLVRQRGAAFPTLVAVAAATLPYLRRRVGVRQKRHECRLCARPFTATNLSADLVYFTGTLEYCPQCARDAQAGALVDTGTFGPWEESVAWALTQLAVELGGPPSRAQLAAPFPMTSPDEARDRSMLLRQFMPMTWYDPPPLTDRAKYSWTDWLQHAGLLGTGVRRSRGVVSVADDGHLCHSMLERHVDDFFARHGIAHERDPHYPNDPTLNPGAYRADWLLPDGTLVEAAGMMSQTEYAEKMARKTKLAAKANLRLIVIDHNDLARLPSIFAEYL